MGRKILFITTDQQRFDSLGCNGGTVARTPVVDALAAEGINYARAYNQNTVCMPARSTMLTGQYVRTHGVTANGIPLPADAPSVAAHLAEQAGYRCALVGKAHFEPGFDPTRRWAENSRADVYDTGAWRGFEHAIQVMHTPAFTQGDFVRTIAHYGKWLQREHEEHLTSYAPLLSAKGGGDTGAPETKNNPIPREWYHTDWVADHTVAWLDSLPEDADWFCWMSFPDPHHPWDPPASELHWWDQTWKNREGGPSSFFPSTLTHDQLREINAKIAVENELIDEACGRVIDYVRARGWLDDTDIFFTTDHGELQGDFGLLYKGPFHVDALMRLPFVWRPAPAAGIPAAAISEPVGHIDLAPTFCEIAGLTPPAWMEGAPLPTAPGSGRERVLCEWDSQFPGYGMHLRSIYRDGWLATAYEPSTDGQPNGLEEVSGDRVLRPCGISYDGTEGELYDLGDDPHQHRNLWDDPSHRAMRDDLVADLYDSLPKGRDVPLKVEAPA